MTNSVLTIAAGVVGVGMIGAVAHANIVAAGGYGMTSAPVLIGLASVLVVGAACVGEAWGARRRALAAILAAALVAGEGWALIRTAERTISTRQEAAAPRIAAEQARTKALARVTAAEASVVALGADSPRLIAALARQADADRAAIEKAAEKGCAANCRQLLQGAAEAATRDVEAARADLAAQRRTASDELATARAALAALPAPRSASPLADLVGVPSSTIDLIDAALASLAINGGGAALVAYAAHGRRRQTVVHVHAALNAQATLQTDPQPTAQLPTSITVEPTTQAVTRDAAREANRFAAATFVPASGRVRLSDIREAYHRWCQNAGLEPLPDREIGAALAQLFQSVGLKRAGAGKHGEIAGIGWRQST